MINFRTKLLNPIYRRLGVPAVLETDDGEVTVTVIDKTAGVALMTADGLTVDTIKPAADVRAYELAEHEIDRAGLTDATLRFNGKLWMVVSTLPRPTLAGEADGEVRMILSEVEE